MSKITGISWADHTAGPWLMCTEVDPCCANCYAREFTRQNFTRMLREAYRKAGYPDWEIMPVWGPHAPRVLTKGFWKDADGFNRNALKNPGNHRPRMFTSMIDWLDEMPAGAIDQYGTRLTRLDLVARFVHKVWQCQHLDWLLLTKRPQLWRPTMVEILELYSKAPSVNGDFCAWLEMWLDGHPPRNVWFGYTAGTRNEWIERTRIAWDIPAVVTWCSAEPLLEELDFHDIVRDEQIPHSHPLNWLVIGLESGPKRRDRPVEWLIRLAKQAIHCGCIPYVKQDCALLPGQQGRIPDSIFKLRGYPQPHHHEI